MNNEGKEALNISSENVDIYLPQKVGLGLKRLNFRHLLFFSDSKDSACCSFQLRASKQSYPDACSEHIIVHFYARKIVEIHFNYFPELQGFLNFSRVKKI